MEETRFIETIEYRGYKVDIYCDYAGQSFFCNLDGEEINFGSYNTDFEDDLKYVIDTKLDTITRFDEFPGARLVWFDNGGYWDIELIYRMRVLCIWLIKDRDSLSNDVINKIILEAENKLKKAVDKLN